MAYAKIMYLQAVTVPSRPEYPELRARYEARLT